jgi:hypothetical protein
VKPPRKYMSRGGLVTIKTSLIRRYSPYPPPSVRSSQSIGPSPPGNLKERCPRSHLLSRPIDMDLIFKKRNE